MPLLAVFLVKPKRQLEGCKLTESTLSVALCLPTTNKPLEEKTYHINKALRDQMMLESEDNADDDEAGLAG